MNIKIYIWLSAFFFSLHLSDALDLFLSAKSKIFVMSMNYVGGILFLTPAGVAFIFGWFLGWKNWPKVLFCYLIVQIPLIIIKLWDLNQGVQGGWRGYFDFRHWLLIVIIMSVLITGSTIIGGFSKEFLSYLSSQMEKFSLKR